MIRIRWRRVIASGAAACTAAVGLVALVQPSAQAAACAATRSSTVSVHGIASESEFLTHYTRSGQTVVDPRQDLRSNVNTGSASVTILACKNPKTNKWTPLTYTVSTDLRDLNLITKGKTIDPVPANGNFGLGVMVPRVTRDRMEIEAVACARKPTKLTVLGAARFLTELPIPKAPTPLIIGAYVLHKVLPEEKITYTCSLLQSVKSVPWSLSDQGEARLVMPTTGHYVFTRRATWTEPGCLDYYCGTSRDQSLEIRSGT